MLEESEEADKGTRGGEFGGRPFGRGVGEAGRGVRSRSRSCSSKGGGAVGVELNKGESGRQAYRSTRGFAGVGGLVVKVGTRIDSSAFGGMSSVVGASEIVSVGGDGPRLAISDSSWVSLAIRGSSSNSLAWSTSFPAVSNRLFSSCCCCCSSSSRSAASTSSGLGKVTSIAPNKILSLPSGPILV